MSGDTRDIIRCPDCGMRHIDKELCACFLRGIGDTPEERANPPPEEDTDGGDESDETH